MAATVGQVEPARETGGFQGECKIGLRKLNAGLLSCAQYPRGRTSVTKNFDEIEERLVVRAIGLIDADDIKGLQKLLAREQVDIIKSYNTSSGRHERLVEYAERNGKLEAASVLRKAGAPLLR